MLNWRSLVVPMLLVAWGLSISVTPSLASEPKLLSVEKIWDQGEHNAFTDIIRYKDKFFVTFRESEAHVGGDGKTRVLVSEDGATWKSAALVEEEGVDLRDPKFSITPQGELMLSMGGSIYNGTKKLHGRQPRVSFSDDGYTWSAPEKILAEGDWLWRVTWHDGVGYGISRIMVPTDKKDRSHEKIASLYKTTDGRNYEKILTWDITGNPNETTLRFMPDGEMLALIRREADDTMGFIGRSQPPYTDWEFTPTDYRLGGPNFIRLPNGEMWAGSRYYPGGAKTGLFRMTPEKLELVTLLPSGGDTSYPGFLWHDNLLWMSYYASHEGKTSIYLAKFKLEE
ncbi:MAG: exo-alpha-sialidase [Planctomycetaceae bacterium]|nr:exo-alpha-sialidase [Planctomycetaceae bacterium]